MTLQTITTVFVLFSRNLHKLRRILAQNLLIKNTNYDESFNDLRVFPAGGTIKQVKIICTIRVFRIIWIFGTNLKSSKKTLLCTTASLENNAPRAIRHVEPHFQLTIFLSKSRGQLLNRSILHSNLGGFLPGFTAYHKKFNTRRMILFSIKYINQR